MEELLAPNKNATCACASFVHDPPKRRKEMETTDVQAGTSRGKLDVTWKQTEKDVTIHFKLDAKDGEADKVEASFTERQMTITLPDGQQQSWCFHGAIDETQSSVSRSKRKFNIIVVKKTPGLWPVLEASEEMTSGEEQQQQSTEDSTEDMSSNNDLPDSLHEVRTKEEEPVLNLNHIKHDFFEKEDTLTIHIYVKNVSKDAVKIHFDKQSFTVKFQTGDGKFLQLHEGATEETVFCWTVNTKNAIIPAGCKMKTTNTCIELKLKKASADRWATLEAPLKKETSSSSKSTSWMPAKQTASSIGASGSSSSVAFDEMSGIDANRRDSSTTELPSASQFNLASSKSQKPTAKVHPLNTQAVAQESKRVGFTGLANLRNTCYMNSVVQVLSNTRELRDYFLGGTFQHDLNRKNRDGQLAVCFAVLLKNLWNGTQSSHRPNRFLSTVTDKMRQFQGFYQHDAQEFLSFFLDGLHEDLNRVQKKAVTPPIENTTGRPDHEIAEETWSAYKKRDDSFLIDLMYGLYKSKITCPNCKEVSTSFEPFSTLPLPLQKNKMTLTVTFMWRDPQRKPTKYQVQLVKDTTVEHLTEVLFHKTGVQPKNMRIFEVFSRLFSKRFKNSSDLAYENIRGFIIVSEVLSEEDAGEKVVVLEVIQRMMQPRHPVSCSACKKVCQNDAKLKRCTKCMKVGYCNQTCQRDDWPLHKIHCSPGPQPVGCPFYLSLPHSHCTYSRIARLMESFARYSVDTFQPPVKADPVVTPVVTLTSTTTTTTSTTTTTTFKPPSTGAPNSTMLPPSNDLHLPSHPSASNLSSSSGSQSSGSLSSLDSISSCSSTATLTAETSHATFDVGQSGDEDEDKDISEERGGGDVDSGVGSISSFQSGTSSQAPSCGTAQGDTKREMGHEKEWASSSKTEKSTAGSTVQSVAASMSSERSVPLFFIKPVDEGGRGRREMERVEDKGDTVLDFSSTQSLSMDWRNNEKQVSYVLVQSKELECEEDESVKKYSSSVSHNITLQQCLEHYHAPEILSDRNEWKCTKCKSKQKAIRQCSLWKLPHIFIIQLKRFSTIFRKVDNKVEFPIRDLDLTPYKSYHDPDDPLALYDLYGVVNHIGLTALGGHYTCRTRCMDPESPFQNEVDWRLFDDENVFLVDNEKKVVDTNAYLLFYRRREIFKPPPPVLPIAAAPAEEETRTEVITEKNEEESSKEQHMEDGSSEVKVSWDSAELEAEKEESHEEKHDVEKDEDESEEYSGNEGNLVIDLEPSQPVSLGYTDMDAVD